MGGDGEMNQNLLANFHLPISSYPLIPLVLD